ncbi:hypothetical protein FRC12_007483 [Ceratobasidium sp. 428]|nr:hypothetical protein FRC12_007483 [Ceratobasidium sp. 428]
MGTRGLQAYLYKKRYYRKYISCNSHPDKFGDSFAAQIPREEHNRLVWITSLIEQIEREVRWRSELNILDEEQLETDSDDDDPCVALYEGRPVLFQDITGIDEGMISVDGFNEIIEWSYVVDLDNRAFTINGRMHFRLDNMPPGSLNKYFWRAPDPHYPGSSCIPTFAHPPSTPIEYIATVSRCPLLILTFLKLTRTTIS